ncbi:glycosyltransferase [Alteribacter keqinensis]|uniref:Glycosyltransferase n=2 Tax=Bacillaceae TaxID=186817 RepID=A0A3M7TR57_9BACI|nr:glycosyltransferase [Alteribacter keqinensis]
MHENEQKNKDRQCRLEELNSEIATLERENRLNKNELRSLESEYQAIKRSRAWLTLKGCKRIAKLSVQLMLRRKNFKQVFSSSWKKNNAKQKIKKIKYKLYESGFSLKALEELNTLFNKADNKILRNETAWELALWHANQQNFTDAEKALHYLNEINRNGIRREFQKKIGIVEAECLHLIGKPSEGIDLLESIMVKNNHPDLFLARASLASNEEERLKWINNALTNYGLKQISKTDKKGRTLYDSLTCAVSGVNLQGSSDPLVTVIIPAYNAEGVISTSIESILKQSWRNIEVIVVDDCSTDETKSIVKAYSTKDRRIKLVEAKKNGGAYAARNLAIDHSKGDFITINDADDWSHPEKIAIQLSHLLENPSVIANTSEQARTTEELVFYRRGKPGNYIFANMSSLLFRREPVLKELGYWDTVRFGADGEFKRRLKLIFGDNAVVDLKTGPLSFQRQTEGSLTGNDVFGFHGYFMGARKEYFHSYSNYHQSGKSLYYDFPLNIRPYPVPDSMKVKRETRERRRHLDVVIASEFRLMGGTNMSNVEEIKAQKREGLRTGLIQMNRYDFTSRKETNPAIRELIDGDQVQMLVYGEKVSCDVLIIRHPPVLEEWQRYLPDVEAKSIKVIVNQPPKREYSKGGGTLYRIEKCAKNLEKYFRKPATWYPIGPLVRETLYKYHHKELKSISLSDEDWVNIIDVEEWQRTTRPSHSNTIKIGRHSRDQYVKWPSSKEEILKVYPEEDPYEVFILGGANAPKKVMGELPTNWRVMEFGHVHPRHFLKNLDVFVYYTHPDWVEAFGRVIFEAMAAGVPVIIPPQYKELFGDAAIYSSPEGVREEIDRLMNDDRYYKKQVEKAKTFVDLHFGYTKHLKRISFKPE